MRKGHGLSRKRLIAFAAVLVLALAVPGMAFAASFSSAKPAAGSSTTVTKPTVSVIVYDKYQVYGSGSRYMYVDGKSVSFKYAAVSGWGWKKQKFTYTPSTALTLGNHTVSIKVKNRRGTTYRYSWSFTVADGVAPVTTSDNQVDYLGSATIHLSASDNVGVAHTYYRLGMGTPVDGRTVTMGVGSYLLEYWSVDAAGNIEFPHNYELVTVKPIIHQFPTDSANLACQGAGCHTPSKWRNNVARLHEDSGRTCRCHQNDTSTPVTKSCVACHGTAPEGHDAATHVAIVSSVVATDATSCNFSGCHGAKSVVTIHGGNCATCHDSDDATVMAVIANGGATCESCHDQGSFDAIHGPKASPTSSVHMAPVSALGPTCTSACHPTSAVASHTGFGTRKPGCNACHFRSDRGPSVVCTDCHTASAIGAAHEFTHTALQTRMGTSLTGKTCTACHGTSILSVGFVSGEHNGCSCHVYNEVSTSVNGCADCHEGAYAPHGFGTEPAHGTGWVAVSGHNTELYGKIGALSDFSAFASSTTTDAAPASLPLPTIGVFWAKDDPNAPAGAKTGLDWNSTITCEDCHTGLVGKEVAGPHGANTVANWGIDPAFTGSFETAYLWSGTGTTADAAIVTDQSGNGVFNPAGGTPFLSKSGIAQYVPTMVNGETGEELVDWDMASGNAHLEPGTVICVKCHDLNNDAGGANNSGWSNYGHEHHAGRLVKYGSFEVGSEGGAVASVTVTAETTTAALASVPGATKVATLRATSLGRETAGACRDCHIAVPHGWKRPRLIVYSNLNGPADQAQRLAKGLPAGDAAPYNAGPSVYEGEGLAGTAVGSGQFNGLSSVKSSTMNADGSTQWSSSLCNACGHHASTDLRSGAWK